MRGMLIRLFWRAALSGIHPVEGLIKPVCRRRFINPRLGRRSLSYKIATKRWAMNTTMPDFQPERQFDLLVLGNPLLDIQAEVSPEYLRNYGLQANDAILADTKHKSIYEELMKLKETYVLAGGAAQNSARGAQYMLPADSVVYFGCVGEDQFADKLRVVNKEAGVKSRYMVQPDVTTGKCAALITGKNRSLVTDLGAANYYKVEHLQEEENWQYVVGANVFYVEGFHLTVCPDAMRALGHHAADEDKIYCMNLSAPFLTEEYKEAMDANSKYWDVLIGNETEAIAYAKSHDLDTENLEQIAKHIALLPKMNTSRQRTVVFTQGTEATLVATADIVKRTVHIKWYPIHKISADDVTDSNGAGDAFAGGFIAGLVQDKDIDTAIDMGQWLAKLSLQELGPSYPSPKKTYG